MGRVSVGITVMALCGVGASAAAGDLSLLVTDPDHHPLANAVVALAPDAGPPPPAAPDRRIIDQQHETFIPLVVILRRGGQIVFRNSDSMHHHAYSFSPIKEFELALDPGQESQPVEFDTPGVAAIGCNIHDQMVAYVYVADTPWTALTDAEGRATIAGLPPGGYNATSWHPRLRPGASGPVYHVAIGTSPSTLTFGIPVLPEPSASARHEHNY